MNIRSSLMIILYTVSFVNRFSNIHSVKIVNLIKHCIYSPEIYTSQYITALQNVNHNPSQLYNVNLKSNYNLIQLNPNQFNLIQIIIAVLDQVLIIITM